MKIETPNVIDIIDAEGVAPPRESESLMQTRPDLRRPDPAEMPPTPELSVRDASERVLPAWIRAQVEQMEVQLRARRLAAVQRISTMQKSG